MRVELFQLDGEIRGNVYLPADPGFVLEGLQMVIEQFSVQSGVPADAIVRDLYSLVTGRVKDSSRVDPQ